VRGKIKQSRAYSWTCFVGALLVLLLFGLFVVIVTVIVIEEQPVIVGFHRSSPGRRRARGARKKGFGWRPRKAKTGIFIAVPFVGEKLALVPVSWGPHRYAADAISALCGATTVLLCLFLLLLKRGPCALLAG
jgi:hypothetical protein